MLVVALPFNEGVLIDDNRGGVALVKFVGYDMNRRVRLAVEAPPAWHVLRTEVAEPGDIPESLRPLIGEAPLPIERSSLADRIRQRNPEE